VPREPVRLGAHGEEWIFERLIGLHEPGTGLAVLGLGSDPPSQQRFGSCAARPFDLASSREDLEAAKPDVPPTSNDANGSARLAIEVIERRSRTTCLRISQVEPRRAAEAQAG
jgi:hypothetical protein